MAKVDIEFPKIKHFSIAKTVRLADINYRQHLGHDKLVTLIQEARACFLESLGVSEMNPSIGYLIADLQIVYLGEAFYGDSLLVDISVQDIGSRSCQLIYQVQRESSNHNPSTEHAKNIIAKAKTGIVFFNYQKQEAMPVPDKIKALVV